MKKNGFTLIEVLVVMAIIAILAAVAIPQFARYRATPVVTKLLNNVELSREEKELYDGHKEFINSMVKSARERGEGKPQQAKKSKPVSVDNLQAETSPSQKSDTVEAEAEKQIKTEAVEPGSEKTEEQLASEVKQPNSQSPAWRAKSFAEASTASNPTSDAEDLSKPIPPIPPIE